MTKCARKNSITDYIDIEYDDENKTAKITGIDKGVDEVCKDIVIPETITHNRVKYKVTSLGNRAFCNCSSMETITIPDSVKTIDDFAFYGCSSLKSISYPDGIESVGEHEFSGCEKLSKLRLPDSIRTIGGMAFFDCRKLNKMELPEGVKEIKYNAFAYCHFKSIYFPASIEKIDDTAFLGGSRFYEADGQTEIKDYSKLIGHRYEGSEDDEGRWRYVPSE